MNWHYEYTPAIWPALTAALFTFALSLYGWRRRALPGALPFAFLMLFGSLWSAGASLELAAVDFSSKVFWFKFKFFWSGPPTVAALCFALEYAHLNRFLNRRNLALLFTYILTGSLLILTNDIHHWIWRDFSFDGSVQAVAGIGNLILVYIGVLLYLGTLPILIWLFIRSPLHRLPVAFILVGQIAFRAAFLMKMADVNPVAPLNINALGLVINAAFYTIALFGFRIFDPIPMARKAVIEQMLEGMLVLDTSQNIVDLNPAAEKLLGLPAARVRGRDAAEFLPAHVGMSARSDDGWMAQTEISLGARFYDLQHLPLKDWDGQALGHLILLHDVTEQKQAQAQLMEQQRALAALKEREQVARELHDELSQGLAFINLQAQAAGELLTAGDSQQAAAHLARLAEVARGTQADVREQITGLSLGILPQEGFLGALRRFMETFSRPYGIQAELNFPDGGSAIVLEPTAEVQLLRIIQEAFTNIRKHSDARRAQVSLAMTGTGMEVIVEDDGRGFDSREGADSGGTFGLRFMGERAAEIGGSLRVESEAGRGTRVIVRVPQTRLPKS